MKEIDFRSHFGFTAFALRRLDHSYRTNIGDFKLTLGDSLLVIGPRERIPALQGSPVFFVLQPSLSDQPRSTARHYWPAEWSWPRSSAFLFTWRC